MFSSEQDARIVIDDLLKDAGWDLKDKFQVRTEVPVHSDTSDEVREPNIAFAEDEPPPPKQKSLAEPIIFFMIVMANPLQ